MQIGDYLLALVMSASLSFVVCSGFYIDPFLQYNPLIMMGLPAVLLFVLFVTFSRRSRLVAGLVVFIALVIALYAFSISISRVDYVFEDSAQNMTIFMTVVVISTVLVFFATRRRMSALALIVIACIALAFIELLYGFAHVGSSVAFVLASFCMLALRYYCQTIREGEVSRASVLPAVGSIFACGVAIVAVSCGLVFAFLTIVQPGVLQVILFQEEYALEQIEVRGVSDYTSLDNEELTSDQTNDLEELSNQENDEVDEDSTDNPDDQQSEDGDSSSSEGIAQFAADSLAEGFQNITHERSALPLLLALLVILLLAPYVVRKLLRVRWVKVQEGKSYKQQVVAYYLFFIERFRRLRLGKEDTLSPSDYAENYQEDLKSFEQNVAPEAFKSITDAYVRVAYGNKEVTSEEMALIKAYYRAFYRNCRKYLGNIKYFFKLYRL